jgi:hypothetical protein
VWQVMRRRRVRPRRGRSCRLWGRPPGLRGSSRTRLAGDAGVVDQDVDVDGE